MKTEPLFEEVTLPAPSPQPATPASTPTAFRHYVLERRPDGSLWELGRGGMGVTYKAIDTNLHCPVALKIIGPQCFAGEKSRHQFIREARLAAQIHHPNVAAIYHLEADDEEVFYAMDYVDGITADAWVKGRGAMPVELALDVIMQVARALTAADCLRVVHRDIKPGNLMLRADPADPARVIVKVIDFGIARSVELEPTPTLTTCAFVGTPQFSSPEQIENLPPDIRSDIYSLGCVLWFLLSGAAPFVGSTPRVMAKHLTSEPPFVQLPPVPDGVRTLLRRMLAKDPNDRPQTPIILHQEICACRGSTTRSRRSFSRLLDESWLRLGTWRPSVLQLAWILSLFLFAPIVWLALSEETDPYLPGFETASPVPDSSQPIGKLLPPPEAVERVWADLGGEPSSNAQPAPENALSSWQPPALQFSNFQTAEEPFWTTPLAHASVDEMNLLAGGRLSFDLDGTDFETPAMKTSKTNAAKSSSHSRKSYTGNRRTESAAPLQRARRTIQGVLNRIF